jgi:hypothetical protein
METSDYEYDQREQLHKHRLHNLFHLVEHTSYHLGQVVDRAKRITEISFQFCQNGLNEKMLRLIIEKF